MMTTKRSMTPKQRYDVWLIASQMVDPIIEKHGIELVQTGQMFGPSFKVTAVEQHIDHILKVADWLMDRDLSG